MSLATFEDANVHLDGKKIAFENAEDATADATSADRIIQGTLYQTFGDVVLTWDANPTAPQVATPGLVREAAAFLMAHFKYARIYSEETQDPNSYAVRLRDEADRILVGLAGGTLGLPDYPLTVDVGQPSFFPDDDYVDLETGEPIRFFTVEMEF